MQHFPFSFNISLLFINEKGPLHFETTFFRDFSKKEYYVSTISHKAKRCK